MLVLVVVLVVVLVLDLLGFCDEKRSDVSAIILFCHCDAEASTHSRERDDFSTSVFRLSPIRHIPGFSA